MGILWIQQFISGQNMDTIFQYIGVADQRVQQI